MSDVAPRLPQELITEIVLRLPAKSIGRFRCVSNSWRCLLSSAQFIREHVGFHILDDPAEQLILISSSDGSIRVVTFAADRNSSGNDVLTRKVICPLSQQNKWYKVEGSCHGLVLVVDKERSKCLLNPLTLEACKVPNFGSSLDPFTSLCSCGLGYDFSSYDYKIVTLSYYETVNEVPDDTFVDIYSVKLKTWRRLANSPYHHPLGFCASGLFVNGGLHWLASEMTIGQPSVIAAFNLASEKFEKLPPPIGVDEYTFVSNELTVLGGCLALVVAFPDCNIITVWVMKEYGVQESWTKLTINCPGAMDKYLYLSKPVCVLGKDEIVLESVCGKLAAYNFSNGVWRYMEVAGVPVRFRDEIVTFSESLQSPSYQSD